MIALNKRRKTWMANACGCSAPTPLLAVAFGAALFTGGCTKPFHLWQADITSTPKPPTLDVSKLTHERVIILPPAAYNHLQGYIPAVSRGLHVACSEAAPPIRAISQYETVNTLSQQELLSDYREDKPDYAPSSILDRRRLGRIHKALAAKYVLQSGIAQFTESTEDRFEFAGLKLIKTRVNSLSLWLRLWDAETGEFLWEAAGEGTVAATLFEEKSSLPLYDIARRLWTLMLQETLLAGKTRTVLTSNEYIFSGE
jgi:hypothetical protein